VYGKGNHAKDIIDILEQRKTVMQFDEDDNIKNSKMSSLIIFDRPIDYITPFCTPFTYESLIDEYFQIK
jgi:hypothetical protein